MKKGCKLNDRYARTTCSRSNFVRAIFRRKLKFHSTREISPFVILTVILHDDHVDEASARSGAFWFRVFVAQWTGCEKTGAPPM